MYFNLIFKVKNLNPIQLNHSIQGACNVIQCFHLNEAWFSQNQFIFFINQLIVHNNVKPQLTCRYMEVEVASQIENCCVEYYVL
jgi:hypothetical protein